MGGTKNKMQIMGKIHIYNLILIYLEASHKDLYSHQFLLYLTQGCSLSNSSSNRLGDLFLKNKHEIRKVLVWATNSHPPLAWIISIDWNHDYWFFLMLTIRLLYKYIHSICGHVKYNVLYMCFMILFLKYLIFVLNRALCNVK